MTTMTFNSFAAPSRPPRRIRCAPCAISQALPVESPALASTAPRARFGPLALVGAIACAHLTAVYMFAATKHVPPAPAKQVAVTIALATPRVEPPPPPPPPKAKAPPPRVKVATTPVRVPAAAQPSSAAPVQDKLPPATASSESVVAAPAPAAAPPAPAVEEKLTEPRGYAGYLRNPAPDYPPAAQKRGLEGQVVLKVHVLATGQPDNVTVAKSSGHAILDDAAIKAVVQWAFAPARRGQSPIDGWVQVPLTFKI